MCLYQYNENVAMVIYSKCILAQLIGHFTLKLSQNTVISLLQKHHHKLIFPVSLGWCKYRCLTHIRVQCLLYLSPGVTTDKILKL